MAAIEELVEREGAEVVGVSFLMELAFLDGRARLAQPRRVQPDSVRRGVVRRRYGPKERTGDLSPEQMNVVPAAPSERRGILA